MHQNLWRQVCALVSLHALLTTPNTMGIEKLSVTAWRLVRQMEKSKEEIFPETTDPEVPF